MSGELEVYSDFILSYRQFAIETLMKIPKQRRDWRFNSVATTANQIAWHLVIWADSDLSHVLKPNESLFLPDEETPIPPAEVIEQRLRTQISEIEQCLSGVRDVSEKRTRFGYPSSIRDLLSHLMQHEIYHAGQLRYLAFSLGID